MKIFKAPMRQVSEFDGFHIEPPTEYSTHEIASFSDGLYHIGSVLRANPILGSTHRAYGTWQPWKTEGAYGPCSMGFWMKYCMPPLQAGEWVSLATFARVQGDGGWAPTCFNVDGNGDAHWMHVPEHGQSEMIVLGNRKIVPHVWTRLDFEIDYRPNGSVLAFINGEPSLFAEVSVGNGFLHQFHAGLYCSGSIKTGWIANSGIIAEERLLARV